MKKRCLLITLVCLLAPMPLFAINFKPGTIDSGRSKKYILHQESFSPWKFFGAMIGGKPYAGDNRGFTLSTADNVTSRIYQNVIIDIDSAKISGDCSTKSNDSFGPKNFYGKEKTGNGTKRNTGTASYQPCGSGGNVFTEMRGRNPLVFGSPNIAWKSNLYINYDQDKGILKVTGFFSGAGFPAFEAFIEDPSGNKAFLGVFSPDRKTQLTRLIFNSISKKKIKVQGFSFRVDQKGNFTGVNMSLGLITVFLSLAEWNALFTSQVPSNEDCGGDCGVITAGN